MGEIAEMMVGGLLCQGCGVYMDDMDIPGYPRACEDCEEYYEEASEASEASEVSEVSKA